MVTMNWLVFHRSSEDFAASAHAALLEGRRSDAEDLFRKAATAEEAALSLLAHSKPRTLGIIAVSAVSLWVKGKNFQQALSIAHSAMKGDSLMVSSREELQELVRFIMARAKHMTPTPLKT
jgi:hypothetical protein